MAQGLIKESKLGQAKGKKPNNKDAKKGKRTIAPRRANLVKNATLIKVSQNSCTYLILCSYAGYWWLEMVNRC